MIWVHVVDDIVREVFTEQPVLHPDLMADIHKAQDGVQLFWVMDEDGGFSAPLPPSIDLSKLTDQQIIMTFEKVIGNLLDAKAQERNYDSIMSACTYIDSTVPQFAAEAQAIKVWRDQVWKYCYETLAQVQVAHSKAMPSLEEFIESLPPFAWPE